MFFKKITKIVKPFAERTKKRERKEWIYQNQNERGAMTINFIEIEVIIRECYELLYANKLDSLNEMENSLKYKTTKTDSGRNRMYE